MTGQESFAGTGQASAACHHHRPRNRLPTEGILINVKRRREQLNHRHTMTDRLDDEIDRVSAELNNLRQQKLEALKRQIRELEGGVNPAPQARRPYRRFTDAEVKELLVKALEDAGGNGISALKASAETGIPYPKVRLIMPRLFKKTGTGRSTLFVSKKKPPTKNG